MKNNVLSITLLLLFSSLASPIFACGGKEEKSNAGQNVKQVTGVLRLVGSEPFTELVVSGAEGSWYIAVGEEEKLKPLQQRTVTINGIETVEILMFPNGLPAGERRTLGNIKVVAVE